MNSDGREATHKSISDFSIRLHQLLRDHGHVLDAEVAVFLRQYMVSLQRDAELASQFMDDDQLIMVLEDVQELYDDTELNLLRMRREKHQSPSSFIDS